MMTRVFGPSSQHLAAKLSASAAAGTAVNMEAAFSQLTLDIIGAAVFNYEFDALNRDSPLIQAVYTALKETEQRATDLLPLWKVRRHILLHAFFNAFVAALCPPFPQPGICG
jgi:carotenoid epsilon hydroxylase